MMILQTLLQTLIFVLVLVLSFRSSAVASSAIDRDEKVKAAPSWLSYTRGTNSTTTVQTFKANCRRELVYEFSVHYKHIHRISLLSCDKMMRNIDEIDQDSNKGSTTRTMRSSDTATRTSTTSATIQLVRSLFNAGSILIKVLPIEALLVNGRIEQDLKSDDYRQLIVLDLSCGNNSLQLLELASNLGLFNSSYHWLLLQGYHHLHRSYIQDSNHVQLIEFLAKLHINMNTELILAKKIDQDQGDYSLFDVWNPGWQFGGKLNVTEVGRFSPCYGLKMYDWFKRTTTIVRRMDMKNVPIRCMIVVTNKLHEDFVNYLEHNHDPHLDSMNRFNFELLSHVRDMFNFTFRLYRTNSWGYLRNGSFDGMIGALVRREVDIGGSPIFFRIERARLIDYTARTWIARPCFIFRQPSRTNLTRNVFLQPFSNSIWLLLFLYGVVKIAFLWKLRAVEENLLNGTKRNEQKFSNKSVREIPKYHSRNSAWHKGSFSGTGRVRGGLGCCGQPWTKDDEGIIGVGEKVVQMKNNRQTKRVQMLDEKRHSTSTSTKSNIFLRCLKDILYGIFIRSFSHHKSKVSSLRENCTSMMATRKITYDGYRNNSKITFNDLGDENVPPGERGTGISGDKNDTCFLRIINKYRNVLRMWSLGGSRGSRGSSFDCPTLFFIGALCQQGIIFRTHLLSGRCIVITTLAFAFCIYQFYSASIVGTLLMEKPKTIKTIRDLIDSPLHIAIEDIIYNRDFFKRTTDPDAIELYKKKVNPEVDENGRVLAGVLAVPGLPPSSSSTSSSSSSASSSSESSQSAKNIRGMAEENVKSNWYNPEDGLKLMKGGGYAFHVDVATAYKIIKETFTEQEICELTEIQLFPPQKMVGIVQKGSPLRKMITYGLRRTTETGLMDRLRKVWHSPKPRCVRQIQPNDLQVGIQTFTSAIFVLICGLVASLSILLLEILHSLWFKVPEQESSSYPTPPPPQPVLLHTQSLTSTLTQTPFALHDKVDENMKPSEQNVTEYHKIVEEQEPHSGVVFGFVK